MSVENEFVSEPIDPSRVNLFTLAKGERRTSGLYFAAQQVLAQNGIHGPLHQVLNCDYNNSYRPALQNWFVGGGIIHAFFSDQVGLQGVDVALFASSIIEGALEGSEGAVVDFRRRRDNASLEAITAQSVGVIAYGEWQEQSIAVLGRRTVLPEEEYRSLRLIYDQLDRFKEKHADEFVRMNG